ncbi:MAG: prepilin-type N-terminal cleavage/methylation domain-containing protein [Bacillota bacterium]
MKLRDDGFTLIEVLIVVAILALLAGLAVPRVFGQMEQTRTTAAITDYGTIGKALSLSMLQDDTVPSQGAIPYLRKWPEKNPWGGTYALSSHAEYVSSNYIRLELSNVPEQSYQALREKMGNLVEKGDSGLVYMYIEGSGGSSTGGGPGGPTDPPATPIVDTRDPESAFHYVAYAGGPIRFATSPTMNIGSLYAGGPIENPPNNATGRVFEKETPLILPSYSTLTALRDPGRPVETRNGAYEINQDNYVLHDRTLVVDGTLTIGGNNNQLSNVTLYVDGNLVAQNMKCNDVLIVVKGSITWTGNNTDLTDTLVVAYGSMTMSVSNLKGALIAEGSLSITGNANLEYKQGSIDNLLSAR